jgi:hypothetical protein
MKGFPMSKTAKKKQGLLARLKARLKKAGKIFNRTKYEWFKSCRSCQHHFKDKVNNVRMCSVYRVVETKDHVNQNGHVRKIVTSISGMEPCAVSSKNMRKCTNYVRNWRKPLQRREVEGK